jgi:anoctamin-10
MYFAFLSFYMTSLVAPAALGVLAFFFHGAFSYLYSAALLVWSVVFVEWWRIKERKLSVKWGVKGASNVEILRAKYRPEGDAWWKQELKLLASLPVIIVYAILLIALMTLIFVFEAFIAQLYDGPGLQYMVNSPTSLSTCGILIASILPPYLGPCSNCHVPCPCPPPTFLLSGARSQVH